MKCAVKKKQQVIKPDVGLIGVGRDYMIRKANSKSRQTKQGMKKAKFSSSLRYKFLYWRKICGPVENENLYERMQKRHLWYSPMEKSTDKMR